MKTPKTITTLLTVGLLAGPVLGQTDPGGYIVTDTGQEGIYDNDGNTVSPEPGEAFYGQDAHYDGVQPTFQDNGDGTVTDLNTGLTWQQTPSYASFNWQEAMDYCENLELGDYDDWRAPTLKELFAIGDFSKGWPYVDETTFDLAGTSLSKDEQYWAANSYVGLTHGGAVSAFGVNHATGHIKAYPAGAGGPFGNYVRAVRGDRNDFNEFVDNGDGTVTDHATGLMWEQVGTTAGMDWEAALAYAESSELAGHSDWRLPNIKELQSIIDYTQSPNATDPDQVGPAIDTDFFTLTELPAGTTSTDHDYGYFWSSTNAYFSEASPGNYYAWYVAFGTAVDGQGDDMHGAGAVRFDTKVEGGPAGEGAERVMNYAICVRDAGAMPSSHPYTVVDTGQDESYDNREAITEPTPGTPFFGQDAQVQGVQPIYTISSDELTALDDNTGLTWQRSADTDSDGDIDAADKMSWTELQAYPAALNAAQFGGYDDWRLPTIKELYSLMDFRGVDPSGYEGSDTSGLVPFIDTTAFEFAYGDTSAGERIIDAQYASNTLYVSTTGRGDQTLFGVNFADGRIKGYGLTLFGQDKTFFAICCRGNPDYGVNDFRDNGDTTVTDQATGLMWQQADSLEGLDWEDALAYAENLELGGYSDWRLPNAKELQSILDYTRSPDTSESAAIDPVFTMSPITNEAGAADYASYWAGTTHANWTAESGRWAAYLCFGRAMGYMQGNWIDVHGAGAQRSDPKFDDGTDFSLGHGPQGDAVRIFNYVRCVRTESANEVPSGGNSNLINISVRTKAGTGTDLLTLGFVTDGSDPQQLLIRGIGPELADYGVSGAMTDPGLELYEHGESVDLRESNDDWGLASNATEVAQAAEEVGAFPLADGSKDGALLTTLSQGVYTVHLSPATGEPGIALAELYSVDATDTAYLANASASARIDIGEQILIAGFVISGTSPVTVLIRGIGPSLTSFGIDEAVADTSLQLYERQSVDGASTDLLIAANDNWDGDSTLSNAFAQAGAFDLASDSKDAALLLSLSPGIYTAHLNSMDGTPGLALIELYAIP